MTKAQLIKELEKFPDDMEVWVSEGLCFGGGPNSVSRVQKSVADAEYENGKLVKSVREVIELD